MKTCSRRICWPCSGPSGRRADARGSCCREANPVKPISMRQLGRVVEEAAGLHGRHHQARLSPNTAAQFRHPPARGRRRHPRHPGHAKLDNTALYTRVATRTVRTVTSPLDKIMARIAERAGPGGWPRCEPRWRSPTSPSSRPRLTGSPGRSCQPLPAQGDVGHRDLPHGRARRAYRRLRGLRPSSHRLQ
jgi:hypothetical protein